MPYSITWDQFCYAPFITSLTGHYDADGRFLYMTCPNAHSDNPGEDDPPLSGAYTIDDLVDAYYDYAENLQEEARKAYRNGRIRHNSI